MEWWSGRGGKGARSFLGRTILLICTGWILNSFLHHDRIMVDCTAVIDRDNLNHRHVNNRKPFGLHRPEHIQQGQQTASIYTSADDDARLMTADESTFRDKIETEADSPRRNGGDERGHDKHPYSPAPILLIPEYITDLDNKQRNESHDNHHNHVPEMEYQPNFVIRCAAKGHPRPNVTWDYEDANLPYFVESTALTYSHQQVDNSHISDGSQDKDETVWVDLKLPMLNNAFYGRLRCKAENIHGNATWELELIHNANSSLFMKVVRITISAALVIVAILTIRAIMWLDMRRNEKLYERLPPQDLEIIHKFKKGLPPPPSPATSSTIGQSASCVTTNGGMLAAASCVSGGIEITVTGDGTAAEMAKEGYRPVRHEASSPDLSKRFLGLDPAKSGCEGGASTPSTVSCASVHVFDSVNSWTNYVPYDDKLETSSKHFKVDYSTILDNGHYGMIFTGKIRNDLTMEWSTVAVKSGKTERDDNFLLESLLTELKILASLPKPHDSIINLRGAYTKMLHQRQALVFVDYCENGNLANFIDLNRQSFLDIFLPSPVIQGRDQGLEASTSSMNNNNSIDNKVNSSLAPVDKVITEVRVDKNGQQEVAITMEGNKSRSFSMKELLSWTWQIADGMNFLHRNKVIHGNLTTGNVFLTSKLTAKLGNIGYTPAENTMGCIDTTTRKYMKNPRFGFEHFSKKSDVWDFGFILWEIFSLREQQFPDNNTIEDFLRNEGAEENHEPPEMDIPQYATEEIFQLMLCCWNEDGTFCPEFDFFLKTFKQMYREIFVRRKKSKESATASDDSNRD